MWFTGGMERNPDTAAAADRAADQATAEWANATTPTARAEAAARAAGAERTLAHHTDSPMEAWGALERAAHWDRHGTPLN